MMKLRRPAIPALAALVGGALLTACTQSAPAPPAVPPPPTTCYVRAQGNNAILEVTGVEALRTCHEFQAWSLKEAPNRILEVSEARPEPSTLVMPALPTSEEQRTGTPTVKQTCSYTLAGTTYTVSDTGGQAIGGGWCKHFYGRSVAQQQAADAKRPRP